MNNNGPQNMDVAASFYTAEGTVAVGRTVTLDPSEVRNMAVVDLMSFEHTLKRIAGMTLTYFGGMMEVGAQITLLGTDGAGSVDIPFSGAMDYHSQIQEAVWWMPKNAEATIILGNASETQVVAGLVYSNGASEQVSLGPFATKTVDHRGDNGNTAEGAADSVRIELAGPVGSLRATGFVTSVDPEVSSGIRFYDPDTIRQPHLFATNLRLRKSEPRMVLKNTGDETISARPRFISVAGKGNGVFELPAVSINAHQSTEVDMKPLKKAAKARSDFDMVSAQIVNDSGGNKLIGALYSTDSRTGTTYDVPLRDSGPVGHSTGSYPWRLDGDYSTIITVSNTRDNTAKYLATINYGGGRYALNPTDLAGGETVVFDLKKIRDQQLPDKDGKTIPLSVELGQFRWSLIGSDSSRLIGRSEVVSQSKGVSSSYSCPICCPNSFSELAINPASSTGPVGGTAVLSVDGFFVDCYGYSYGPYAWWVSEWWVENPSVISLAMISQGSAQMGCLSVGQSQFYGDTYQDYYENDGMDCYDRPLVFYGGCCATVSPTVTISFNDSGIPLCSNDPPPPGSAGYQCSAPMTAQGNPAGGTYSWSTTSNKVTLSDANLQTVTVIGQSESASQNDVVITVTYMVNGQPGTAQASTTVQKPTFMGYVSTDFSRSNTLCGSGQAGWEKTIVWQVQDKFHGSMSFAMAIWDSIVNNTPNSCNVASGGLVDNPEDGKATGPGGLWAHHYGLCSSACTSGTCSVNGTQTYTINGFDVGLSFTMTCTSITVAGH